MRGAKSPWRKYSTLPGGALLPRFVEPDRTDNKFYGENCPKHGKVLRYRTNGHCVQCAKDYHRARKQG